MNLPVIYQNYQQILSTITSSDTFDHPTLFIRGGASDYVKEEDLTDIKLLFPDAELATVEKAGHWVHAVAPAALLKLVNDFLSRE